MGNMGCVPFSSASGEHEAYFILSRIIAGDVHSPLSKEYHPKDLWHGLLLPGTVWRSAPMAIAAALYLNDAPHRDPYLARYLLRRARHGGSVLATAILADAEVTGEFDIRPDPAYGIAGLEEIIAAPLPDNSADLGAREDVILGHAEAQWRLGRLLVEGHYIPADPPRGKTLIISAADAGNQAARQWLSTQKLDRN